MKEYNLKPLDSVVKKPVWKAIKIKRKRVDENGKFIEWLPDSIGFMQKNY